jgi:hypothetical protein
MKTTTVNRLVSSVLTIACLCAVNVRANDDWRYTFHPAEVEYAPYSGSLDDSGPPKKGDHKVSFRLSGSAARELFNGIGPDRREACTAEPGTRVRYRGDLYCSRKGKSTYACYFGIDLRNGKSTHGIIC